LIFRSVPPPIPGRLLLVGGQRRKVGKTALCVDLLRLTADLQWTAVKITPYVDAGCPARGPDCVCAPWEHTYSIREETSRSTGKDTSRFLEAGATRSIWVQTKSGREQDALAPLGVEVRGARNVLVESDSLVRHWRPHFFILVVDPRKIDFRRSARAALRLSNVLLLRAEVNGSALPSAVLDEIGMIPQVLQPVGYPLPLLVQRLVRRLFDSSPDLNSGPARVRALTVDP
jgi:hypothetical protein